MRSGLYYYPPRKKKPSFMAMLLWLVFFGVFCFGLYLFFERTYDQIPPLLQSLGQDGDGSSRAGGEGGARGPEGVNTSPGGEGMPQLPPRREVQPPVEQKERRQPEIKRITIEGAEGGSGTSGQTLGQASEQASGDTGELQLGTRLLVQPAKENVPDERADVGLPVTSTSDSAENPAGANAADKIAEGTPSAVDTEAAPGGDDAPGGIDARAFADAADAPGITDTPDITDVAGADSAPLVGGPPDLADLAGIADIAEGSDTSGAVETADVVDSTDTVNAAGAPDIPPTVDTAGTADAADAADTVDTAGVADITNSIDVLREAAATLAAEPDKAPAHSDGEGLVASLPPATAPSASLPSTADQTMPAQAAADPVTTDQATPDPAMTDQGALDQTPDQSPAQTTAEQSQARASGSSSSSLSSAPPVSGVVEPSPGKGSQGGNGSLFFVSRPTLLMRGILIPQEQRLEFVANATFPDFFGAVLASDMVKLFGSDEVFYDDEALAAKYAAHKAAATEAAMSKTLSVRMVNGVLRWSRNPADWPGKHAIAALPGKKMVVDPVWIPLVVRLANDGFPLERTMQIFAALGTNSYSPAYMSAKVTELHRAKGIGIGAASKEACQIVPDGFVKPLSDFTVGSCRAFVNKHSEVFTDIRKKHGVSANVILAIMLVETGFGANLGDDSALRVLGSMASCDTPEMLAWTNNKQQVNRVKLATLKGTLKDKSEWAYNEVKSLVLYAETNKLNAAAIPGSMYGAIGLCQFMPSNILPYGVDGNGDGKVDLFNPYDALYSVASYLEAHGWRGAGKSTDKQHRVIMQYNQDNWYASSVLGIADQLGKAFAAKSKISDAKSAYAGILAAPKKIPGIVDPSLPKRPLRLPDSAKVVRLNNYEGLLD